MNLKRSANRKPLDSAPKLRVNANGAQIAPKHGAPQTIRALAGGLNVELDDVHSLLDALVARRYQVLIFMTGDSVRSLFEITEELGRHRDLLRALQATKTACRSPKAAALLRRFKLQPTLGEHGVYTTRRLISSLGRLDLEGRTVVRLDGAPGDVIANRLREQRARSRILDISETSADQGLDAQKMISRESWSTHEQGRTIYPIGLCHMHQVK